MTTEKRAICDLCGAADTYQGEIAPEQWGSLRVVGKIIYREYHICPMCMPPVEGKQRQLPPEKVQEVKDFVREAMG